MGHSREELISFGQTVPTGRLLEWTSGLVTSCRKAAPRLQRRGIQEAYFDEVKSLIDSVRKFHERIDGNVGPSIPEVEQIKKVFDEALDFWREVKKMAKIEFGTTPDVLVRFRTGVRVGFSVGQLAAELQHLNPLLREFQAQLAWLGANDEFIQRGEVLAGKLREAEAKLGDVRQKLSPDVSEFNFQKGRLYDLARKLVRVGQLEFRNDPEQATPFNYDAFRRQRSASVPSRTKAERSAAIR